MWRFTSSFFEQVLAAALVFVATTLASGPRAWAAPSTAVGAGGEERVRRSAGSKETALLVRPFKELFDHRAHKEGFHKSEIACSDCHNFSIKTTTWDPTSPGVQSGFLGVERGVCHQCHLGQVSLPRPSQCTLCHREVNRLAPLNHRQNWRLRHGVAAQADADSCRACHSEKTCSQCHSQRNPSRPVVHRANFRLTHSLEARANPQNCVTCHASLNTCVQCHAKGLMP